MAERVRVKQRKRYIKIILKQFRKIRLAKLINSAYQALKTNYNINKATINGKLGFFKVMVLGRLLS